MNKKAILLTFLASIFGICCLFAQQQKMFYYYKGDSISLNVNSQHFLVYADANKVSKEMFEKDYRVTEWIEDGNNGILEAQVNIPNDNYNSIVYVLKAKEYIIDIEPVIGNTVLYNTSRLFYVKLHTPQDYSLLSSIASRTGAEIRGEVSFCENWYELSVDKNSTGNSIETANQFWESQYFADIDPGFIFHFEPMSNTSCVSDSRFDEQWGMQAIKACSAWKITKGDTNVRIAVIDMGIDVRHQEFDSTHVVFSYDIETNTPLAKSYFTEDWPRDNNPHDSATRHYHGMHVGGIIFANHNRYEVAGCCPNSSLVNISTKFIDDDSIASKMANSITLAVLHGAKVINNSWGDAGGLIIRLHSTLVENAIDYAIDQNRIVVFSAGNEGDSVNYPARYRPDILTVGAVDSNLFVASFSNIGPELDVVAPGVSILSTYNPNTYHSTKGTSMAAPHVSGVMGLLFSINPNLTTREARDIVELTAQKIGIEPSINDSIHNNGLWDYFVGYGLLDAHRAVLKAAYHKVYGDTVLTICDTNIHPYTVRAPHNANIDSVSFFWTCSDNLQMVAGQNKDSVWVKFTNSGIGQLQCHIIHDGDTVISTLDISNMSGRTMYDNLTLNSSITYPDTFVLSREVVVDSLTMLTWQDKTVLCTPDCRLIVRPRGLLTLNHTTLTSACPNELWQGIEVVGNRTKRQLAIYQGKVELRNGAVIENAHCGIRTGLREDTVVFATTGGIIIADSAFFVNNRRAVEFLSYENTHPNGSFADNQSHFQQCVFSVDDNNLFAQNSCSFIDHVTMWQVRGVEFNGCTFKNTTTAAGDRRHAIYTADAGFEVNTYCRTPYVGCDCPENHSVYSEFSGFTTAVETNTEGTPYAVIINSANFRNNTTGLEINGNTFATVTRNDFNQQNTPSNLNGTGLYLNNCSGYQVEENRFHRASMSQNVIITGIRVQNNGAADNIIYRNIFDTLNYGIYVSGKNGGVNSGLQMLCEDFNENSTDIYTAERSMVSAQQGSLQTSAGNTFEGTDNYNIENLSNQNINYYYTGRATPGNQYYPNLLTTNVVTCLSNSANPCASTLCDNGSPRSLAQFQSDMDAGTYYETVRTLMSDTVLDLNALEQWHAAAQPLGDPYSLTETRFMLGYSEPFVADADDAELSNYAEFHALKVSLRDNASDNDGSVGADDPSSLQPGGHINWYALTPSQIAQLQTIAERNTGRASVMAKGVLCFFHGICYEDDPVGLSHCGSPTQGDDTTGTRAKRTAMDTDNDATLSVYPNPTDDVLFIELFGGAEISIIALYDLQGRVVETRRAASLQKTTATLDMKSVPAGVYILRVTDTDGKEFHRKIVRK